MKWQLYKLRSTLEMKLAARIAEILQDAIDNRGKATLLVSGGSTPKGLFDELSQRDIEWDKVTISLVDDRLDPVYSNEKMIKDLLMQNKASKANFISLINADMHDIRIVEKRIEPFANSLDCVVLGMGLDGHTASIFPEDEVSMDALTMEDDEQVVIYTNAPKIPLHRVSFMPNVLADAEHVFLHVHGKEKKELIEKIIEEKAEQYPIFYFLREDMELEVFYAD